MKLSDHYQTEKEREVDLDRIWDRLAARIAEEAPPGLGGWDLAWALVEDPSQVFLRVARRYVAGEAHRASLVAAARDVRDAWLRAGHLYRRDVLGLPESPS